MIILLAGLGFGDEGKGASVDALTRQYQADLVVRYNGGHQAAHNVVLPDGRHHTFSQSGSGAFAGAKTLLSRYMLFSPLALYAEMLHLKDLGLAHPEDSVNVDERCVLVTQFHRLANRIREAKRGNKAHGSCGLGIGEARALEIQEPNRVPVVRDLLFPTNLLNQIEWVKSTLSNSLEGEYLQEGADAKLVDRLVCEFRTLTPEQVTTSLMSVTRYFRICSPDRVSEIIRDSKNTIFEGAQGFHLDEKWGTAPHNTWTNLTFDNAYSVLWDALDASLLRQRPMVRVGVTRSYLTRHGAGPLKESAIVKERCGPERHNLDTSFQGKFRYAWFDVGMFAQACSILRLDNVIVTHMDKYPKVFYLGDGFRSEEAETFLEVVGSYSPILATSWGPTYEDFRFLLSSHESKVKDWSTEVYGD